ncbi:MAG: hypothetical protein LBP76_15345 [Treponema sp.]|jgi:hypothetical protein|nr:hypothetical protein [Treponema sp.]
MERKVFLVIGMLLVLGFVSFSCFAQSSNDTQKFVGTWNIITANNANGGQYIFHANGTGTYKSKALVYAIPVSGKIVLCFDDYSYSYEYYFTDNGNTLIFYAPGIEYTDEGSRILKKGK